MEHLTVEQRFWKYADKDGPPPEPGTLAHERDLGRCWVWTGTVTGGYPRIAIDSRPMAAHRYSYELAGGTLVPGLQLDHLCRVTWCVNPLHLEQVSPRENTMRGKGPAAINAAKELCANGHEFTESNTYYRPDGNRTCKECGRDRWRRWYHSKKASDPTWSQKPRVRVSPGS